MQFEEGYIYIAQPPLYKVTRRKREEYVESDAHLTEILLNLGADGMRLETLSGEEIFATKELRELLEQIVEIEEISDKLRRFGIRLEDYLTHRNAETGAFPQYCAYLNELGDDLELKFLANTDELKALEAEIAAKKILDALKGGKQESVNHIIDSYIELLNTGFKTIKTTSQNILTPEGKRIFQDLDFADLGDTLCFDKISNVDLIFSNIIYRDNKIYLIDYEWVFKGALPLKYSLFRAFRSLHDMDKLGTENYFTDSEFTFFNAMERRLFLFEVAGADSFYQYQEKFAKVRSNLYHRKLELENEVTSLIDEVSRLENEVSRLEDRIKEMQDEILYYALSKSWKITRPMRKIFTHLRGLK